jgi:hypothetical protein
MLRYGRLGDVAMLLLMFSLALCMSANSPTLHRERVDHLRFKVEQRRKELAAAQAALPRELTRKRSPQVARAEAALAKARARLAQAQGNTSLAAAQWKKVADYWEAELSAWEKTTMCCGYQAIRGPLAIARAHVAESEAKLNVVLAELRTCKSITYRIALCFSAGGFRSSIHHGRRWV